MKKILLPLTIVVIVAGLFAFAIKWHSSLQKTPVKIASSAPAPSSKPPQAPRPPLMTVGEWQQYHNARQLALQANPSLQSQYKDILTAMDAQEAKSEAAMLKADPKIGPVLAKLKILRAHNGGAVANATGSSSTAKPQPASNAPVPTLTLDDMQELRTAKTAAIEANPDLQVDAKKLQDKMRAFEDTLDADMLKKDPQVQPLIAKFDSGRRNPSVSK